MSNKNFFTAIIYGISTASLCAQAPSALSSTSTAQTALSSIVDNLTHYALFVLLGVIVLAGVIYFAYVWKHCTDFQRPHTNAPKAFLLLLIWATGLCTMGSGCINTQQVQAADIWAKKAAENRSCPMNQHYDNPTTTVHNSSLYDGYSNWYGSSFCRVCGQRISKTSN